MKLLTKEQRERLLKNGRDQRNVKGTKAEKDFWPVVKLFNPAGAATWLLTELDPEDEDVAWGLCDLGQGFPEFGTVRISECRTSAAGSDLASSATASSKPRRRSRATSTPPAKPAASSNR